MEATDYDGRVHRAYARGRALSVRSLAVWLQAFAGSLPARRPLDGLDLDAGTGRFSPALAEKFGPVQAVEPSDAMRGGAERESVSDGVRYMAGSSEAIPAEDGSVDCCLMFLVWHHVRDRARAASEIVRVLRPGGFCSVDPSSPTTCRTCGGYGTFLQVPLQTLPCTARSTRRPGPSKTLGFNPGQA